MASRRSKNTLPVSQAKPAERVPGEPFYRRYHVAVIASVLLALVLFFYLGPLFSENASIQWDAVDVHYTLQKYFSDQLHHGKLPVWTPFSFSGMPLIGDPEIGAWYPLNWPFFVAGITPRAIEWELALHAALACAGAWLLAFDLLGDAEAAGLAGIFYAFSGFFAGHSSHVGTFQGAALFPWLLWAFRRAVAGSWWRYGMVCAAVGACIMMAGHFQTALYCYFGLFFFAVSLWRLRAFAVLAGVMAIVVVLSTATWWPALELAKESIRAQADFSSQTNAPLIPGALLTLISPDHFGALQGPYKGPGDITEFYFYAGILLPVLALLGLLNRALRPVAVAMLIPSVWYAFGPAGGLYSLIVRLPGFSSVRAPVHIWFVSALALALLAAGGGRMLGLRFSRKWIVPALGLFAFGDVYLSNVDGNPMAYARKSYDAAYGNVAAQFDGLTLTVRTNPLHRFWAPADSNVFGPLNSALLLELETTYGYNPLELRAYSEYMAAARTNEKLLNGLSVTHKLDLRAGRIAPNPDALPRVTFPAQILSQGGLDRLDPAVSTLMKADSRAIKQDPNAKAEIVNYEPGMYRVKYTAATPSVMRIAVPYFPGWRAQVDGAAANVFVLDRALSGVIVPAGSHELVFRFVFTSLTEAILISASAWMLVLAAWFFSLFSGRAQSSPSAAPLRESPAR